MLKSIRDFSELGNILPTFVAAKFICLTGTSLFQVNMNTFVRLLHVGTEATDNILIIQGGIFHNGKQSFYLKSVSYYFPETVRIFLFEKINPLVDIYCAEDFVQTTEFIRQNYSGRLVVIGYSMGGVLLSSYLAQKYRARHADLFILCCNSFDFKEFREVIDTHSLFNWIQKKDLRAFGVKTVEELMEKECIDYQEQQDFMNNLIEHLNETSKYWHSKTLYIVAEKDPITCNFKKTLEAFQQKPHTINVKGGWHCCSATVYSSFSLACSFLNLSNKKKKNVKISEIFS